MRRMFVFFSCLWILVVSACHREDRGNKHLRIDQTSSTSPENSQSGEPSREIEALIDTLVETADPGFGYSVSFSGSEFLPYDDTAEMSTLIIGAAHSKRSDSLRAIVQSGITAVPNLMKHMNDERPTRIPPVSGMMWMSFSDEYDFNRRTRATAPKGVNGHEVEEERDDPRRHVITVGDMCFVALGQIVNRYFSATRYQPTGGLIISSPTYSPSLRKVILDDWSTLTAESHKRLLIEDFQKPDYEERRIGAYLRLSRYYPETIEELVVKELTKPTFDVFVINEFCRNSLYPVGPEPERKTAYDEFIQSHGEAFAPGIEQQLFEDLDSGTRFGTRPRELLVQLFGHPANVQPADRPALEVVSDTELARFVATLTHDNSPKVGDIVKTLFLKRSDDDYFALACLSCLASRGYEEFLLAQLEKIDPTVQEAVALHSGYIRAVSQSKTPAIRAKLLELLKLSANEAYFMAALPAVDRSHDKEISDAARRLLDGLPADTEEGAEVLQMIRERFPEDTKAVFESFLSTGSLHRAETVCRILWNENPRSKELLVSLLDDQRELSGFSVPMRVCDRVAQAFSYSVKDIHFDPGASKPQKDEQIKRLKEYCQAKQK